MSNEVLSPKCFDAISAAREHRNALLKYISIQDIEPSDERRVGYHLPGTQWQHFTLMAPSGDHADEQMITILWDGWGETFSMLRCSGRGSAAIQYRIVGFANDFPFLHPDRLGDLLILVWTGGTRYLAWVLNTDADIEEVESNLGLEVWNSWAIYLGNDHPIINRVNGSN